MSGVTATLVASPELSNFAQLVEELKSLLQRDDVGDNIGVYTRTTEAVINRRLSRDHVRPSINTQVYTANAALPARFLAEVDMIIGDKRVTPVDVTRAALLAENQVCGDGERYYVIRGNNIEFLPALSGETAILTFVERLEPISSAASVNWIMRDHPDVYLYGCAAYADIWEDDDERARDFLALFNQFLDDAIASYPARNEMPLRLDPMFPQTGYNRFSRWT